MTVLETGLVETASQTAGPYVHIGCTPVYTGIQRYRDEADLGSSMINDETKGRRIRIFGMILDGRNDAVKDGLAEIWHADHAGLYAGMDGFGQDPDPNFSFWGRQPTDHETGAFEFRTIKPGRVPLADGRLQAPHVNFYIVARGINLGLHTRMYFPDERDANAEDPVLQIPEMSARRGSLIATGSAGDYEFNICLQGDMESVFFDV